MRKWASKSKSFLLHDLWNAELSSLSRLRRVGVRLLRIFDLVIKGFRYDDLPVHAAALTFASLMALVPLLAIAFAVLKGLGGDQEMRTKLADAVVGMPVQFANFVQQILDIVDRTSFTAIGWVGVLVLFVTAVQVLSSVENSFNRVWGVTKSRSWVRKFTNYTSITVLVPVLIMVAFAISATLQNEAIKHGLGEASFLYRTVVRLAPLVAVWIALFLLITFMPNTHVRRRPAAVSALISALFWIFWQKIYISLQVGVARYNAIYGTFASVPIFLMWLSVCWMIILLGSEIAFALQNHTTFHMERTASQASVRSRITMGLSVLLDIARGFAAGRTGFDADEFAQRNEVPVRLVHDLLAIFVRSGIIAELAESPGRYVLMRTPDRIAIGDVVRMVTEDGASPETVGLSHPDPAIEKVMSDLDGGLQGSLGATTFAGLLKS